MPALSGEWLQINCLHLWSGQGLLFDNSSCMLTYNSRRWQASLHDLFAKIKKNQQCTTSNIDHIIWCQSARANIWIWCMIKIISSLFRIKSFQMIFSRGVPIPTYALVHALNISRCTSACIFTLHDAFHCLKNWIWDNIFSTWVNKGTRTIKWTVFMHNTFKCGELAHCGSKLKVS